MMSDEVLVTVITAAMFIAAVGIIAIAQYPPMRLWYGEQINFDLGKLLDRSGQVGVLVIAAGILDSVLGDGSAGEVAAVTIFGAGLILLSSLKVGSKP